MTSPHTVSDGLADELIRWLPGAWTLERECFGTGRGEGKATFREVADHAGALHYREDLRLRPGNGDQPFQAFREFRYQPRAGRLLVIFWEPVRRGQTYLDLQLRQAGHVIEARGQHPCGEDLYDHAFRWHLANGEFETDVTISGTRKNARVLTHARRQATPH